MKIESRSGARSILFEEATLRFSILADREIWAWDEQYLPYFILDGERVYFSDAERIVHREIRNGVGCGILSSYQGFAAGGRKRGISFETFVWAEESTGDVFFEWIPLQEDGGIGQVCWPGPMAFEEGRNDWYTLVTERQGYLIPNDWAVPSRALHFDGMFLTAGSYMPWFSQDPGGQRLSCDCADAVERQGLAGASGGRSLYACGCEMGAGQGEDGIPALPALQLPGAL